MICTNSNVWSTEEISAFSGQMDTFQLYLYSIRPFISICLQDSVHQYQHSSIIRKSLQWFLNAIIHLSTTGKKLTHLFSELLLLELRINNTVWQISPKYSNNLDFLPNSKYMEFKIVNCHLKHKQFSFLHIPYFFKLWMKCKLIQSSYPPKIKTEIFTCVEQCSVIQNILICTTCVLLALMFCILVF